jgi:mannosyl-3-phosphoglycerate phosphatase
MKSTRPVLVFTDLDGTLLDSRTYSYAASLRGIELLRSRGAELVLVSSKTLPEMEELHQSFALASPMIFENGGGIAYPRRRAGGAARYRVELTGLSAEELAVRLKSFEELIGRPTRTILQMSLRELSELTGLDGTSAWRARMRRASLPFIIPSGESIEPERMERIEKKARREGLFFTRGDRFFHLSSRRANKGAAVKRVAAFYRKSSGRASIATLGIGDSENDIPMLRAVRHPYLVRREGGGFVKTGFQCTVTRGIGPAGFTEAMESFFR